MKKTSAVVFCTIVTVSIFIQISRIQAGNLGIGQICRSNSDCQSGNCQPGRSLSASACAESTTNRTQASSQTSLAPTNVSQSGASDAAKKIQSAFEETAQMFAPSNPYAAFKKISQTFAKTSVEDAVKTSTSAEMLKTIANETACQPPDKSKLIPKTKIFVPKDISTIQGAVDAAYSGTIIVVDPKQTYQEDITVNGKYLVITSAADAEKVPIRSSSESVPNFVFKCGGGGKLIGLDIEGGSIAVKVISKDRKDGVIIDKGYIGNVTTGILSSDATLDVGNTKFEDIDGRAIYASKSAGNVSQSFFDRIDKTAIFTQKSAGLLISNNTFSSQIGEGAVYAEGGAVVIDKNTFDLKDKTFGMILAYDPKAKMAKTAFEVTGNKVLEPQDIGILVLGNGQINSFAYIDSNTINLSSLDNSVELLATDWLGWVEKELAKHSTALYTSYTGILLLDLQTTLRSNSVQGMGRGFLTGNICGTYQGNSATKNFYGFVTMSSAKDCSLDQPIDLKTTDKYYCDCLIPGIPLPDGTIPTPAQLAKYKPLCNVFYNNSMGNLAGASGLAVPAPPEPAKQY